MDNEDIAYKPGDILAGKYRVDRAIGLGGFGAVLAATHLQLEESVAIKVLLPHAAKNPAASERFLREARAAVRIRSEHVARVSDVGQLPDTTPYMVMEFLQGQDLASLLKTKGGQAVHDVAEWVLQACEALAEAHSLGIVHRDLKPANLFLTYKVDGVPCVKVLDFGISKLTNEGADKGMTKTSDVMGSPFYMSPEQMRSTRSVDARSDIWALGAIIYELLAGAPPFDAETMTALVVSIMQEPPRELSMFRRDIPPAMRDIIMTCLQKDPSRRFPDVASLAQALAPFAPQRAQTNVARVLAVSGGAHRASNPMVQQPSSGPQGAGSHGSISGSNAEGASNTMASMPASVAFASSGTQHSPSSPPHAQSGPVYPGHPYGQSGFGPPPPTQPGNYSASQIPGVVPQGVAPLVASGASPAQSWGGTYMGKKQGSSKTAMIVGISAVAVALLGAGGGALYLAGQSKSSSKTVEPTSVAASHEKGTSDEKEKPSTAQPVSDQPVAQSTAIATVTPSDLPLSTATPAPTQSVAVTPGSSHASADPKKPGSKPKESSGSLPPPPVGPPPGPPPVVTLPPPPVAPPPPSKPKPPPDTLFGRPD